MLESASTATSEAFRVLQETTTANKFIEDPSLGNRNMSINSVLVTPCILGTTCLFFSMIFFAVAIHYNWIAEMAPRAANRPKVIMKNMIMHGISEKWKNKIYVYPFAFLHWAYKLTYKECLGGIPGTGTRKEGREGPLVKVNLDGVIWLKYQTLLFKIGLVVAFLCTFVLIPINTTAPCDKFKFGQGTCAQHDTMSGFAQTTISHIPPKIYNDDPNMNVGLSIDVANIFNSLFGIKPQNETQGLVVDGITTTSSSSETVGNKEVDEGDNETDGGNTTITTSDIDNDDEDDEDEEEDSDEEEEEEEVYVNNDWSDEYAALYRDFWVEGQTWRIVLTCFCCIIIYVYSMYLLWYEWIENVALRRAFFLEASHYGQRMIELNKLDLDFVKKKKSNDSKTREREEESYPPYLTHPEIRETPPSVGLYSVLYQLPNSMVTYDTDGATSIERQLVATRKFFDMVVPAQPGFSSSVVAVTMIPKANLVARAWMKWRQVEMRLQKLRHIRRAIAKAESETKGKKDASTDSKEDEDEIDFASPDSNKKDKIKRDSVKVVSDLTEDDVEILRLETNEALDDEVQTDVFKYEDFDVKAYARSVGFSDEVDKISLFVDGMGIEEFNVFAYNCALMEGGPGSGLGKKILNMYDVEKLRELEEEILDELDGVHQELIDARKDVLNLDKEEAVALEENGDDGIPSVADLVQGSLRSGDTNDEWRVAEDEFSSALTMMFSENTTNTREKTEGIFSCIKEFYQRVMIGSEKEFDPKYYGLENDREGTAFKTDIDHPSYAVITFATRHSAIVARQCLADGVASNNWIQVKDLPIYPLAEAPANMWTYTRGFMRPVTPTISYVSKKCRKGAVYIFLVLFIGSYTALLNYINNFLWNPDYFEALGLDDDTWDLIVPTLSGVTQTLVFTVCPQIFKFVAFKSGDACSYEAAEQNALIYFWYFYLIVRYLGQIVFESFLKFTQGEAQSIEQLVIEALTDLASTTPTILGPFALSYIIYAATVTWPLIYFLQMNNFLTSWLRLGLINRLLKGGGPGQELSYRIYADSGYVLSCMTTLAPVCPLIGPFAFLYFILLAPMARWMAVFAYRPKFDSGGDKWPKLHHIIMTSLLVGQVLTALTFLLKGNFVAGMIIAACIIPTLIFNSIVKEKFMRPFSDASLHYTGRIHKRKREAEEEEDPWQEREEFRRWLVDCHKASYLPTCMSGGEETILTAEPAVVIPKVKVSVDESARDHYNSDRNMRAQLRRQDAQKGGTMRRQRFGL